MQPTYSALLLLMALGAGAVTAPAVQEERSDETKNLKYFPKGTKRSELIPEMRKFSFALGVPCTHCHGTKEQTGFDLRGVDFSLDIKPTKEIARDMLRMVDEINSKLLPKISHRSDLNLKVSCFTCHSGMALPDTIEARVLRTIEKDGLEAAIADYRALRDRQYGNAAYNFREQPLVEVAAELNKKGNYGAAAAISRLNLEFVPGSLQSKLRLAEAYVGLGDKENARRIYQELLAANPDDRRLKQRLEELDNPGN